MKDTMFSVKFWLNCNKIQLKSSQQDTFYRNVVELEKMICQIRVMLDTSHLHATPQQQNLTFVLTVDSWHPLCVNIMDRNENQHAAALVKRKKSALLFMICHVQGHVNVFVMIYKTVDDTLTYDTFDWQVQFFS